MTAQFTKYDETLGKNFTLHYNPESIVAQLQEYIDLGTVDEHGDCDEYPIGDDGYGNTKTQEERDTDIAKMKEFIAIFQKENPYGTDDDLEVMLSDLIDNQPRKKNESFAKGRVNNVHIFHSFGIYWEDSYGSNTPALRLRSIGDYECTLAMETYVIGY